MSTSIPTKLQLREQLLLYFNQKKSASECHRLLSEKYPGYAPTERTCRRWFERFKSGDFDITDKERPGQPKKFEDEGLRTLLITNPSQTQEELAEKLGVDQATISRRLKAMGMIQVRGKWSTYEDVNTVKN